MKAKTPKTEEQKLEEKILQCCEGSRQSAAFMDFTDEEYVGYQTAMVVNNSYNICLSVDFKLKAVRRLFKEGKL